MVGAARTANETDGQGKERAIASVCMCVERERERAGEKVMIIRGEENNDRGRGLVDDAIMKMPKLLLVLQVRCSRGGVGGEWRPACGCNV